MEATIRLIGCTGEVNIHRDTVVAKPDPVLDDQVGLFEIIYATR